MRLNVLKYIFRMYDKRYRGSWTAMRLLVASTITSDPPADRSVSAPNAELRVPGAR